MALERHHQPQHICASQPFPFRKFCMRSRDVDFALCTEELQRQPFQALAAIFAFPYDANKVWRRSYSSQSGCSRRISTFCVPISSSSSRSAAVLGSSPPSILPAASATLPASDRCAYPQTRALRDLAVPCRRPAGMAGSQRFDYSFWIAFISCWRMQRLVRVARPFCTSICVASVRRRSLLLRCRQRYNLAVDAIERIGKLEVVSLLAFLGRIVGILVLRCAPSASRCLASVAWCVVRIDRLPTAPSR